MPEYPASLETRIALKQRTFGDKGVVKGLSQRRAAQYKAISHRRASLAPRNVAPPSNTLLATLPSLTILEKGSKITGEQR